MAHPDDPEDLDPALARERTRLAWRRTAIAFAAVGGAVLKENVAAGLSVLAMAPLIWEAGRLSRGSGAGKARPRQLLLIAAAVTTVAFVVLLLVLLGHGSPAGFRPPLHAQR
jgi:uncharacterized membrane protein YidH (DUF202 family)